MNEKITASHILCSTEKNGKEKALNIINKLKKKIEDGQDFSELAEKYSDCPSKARGGNLGSFERGKMVEEFDEAAFQLESGEVSDIVETDFGYHLIYRSA